MRMAPWDWMQYSSVAPPSIVILVLTGLYQADSLKKTKQNSDISLLET